MQRALQTLKQSSRRVMAKVFFAVSEDIVQVVDRDTERPIHTSKLREISYCGIDLTNKKIVALIVSAPDLSFQCHAVVLPGKAQLVTQVISAAFVIAADRAKKEQQARCAGAMTQGSRCAGQGARALGIAQGPAPRRCARPQARTGRLRNSAHAVDAGAAAARRQRRHGQG